MSKYYNNNKGILYHGDSELILKEMLNESIDCVITSPPYDNLRAYKGFKFNYEIFQNISQELYRIMKKGATMIWIVNDKYIQGSRSLTSFKQALYFKELGFNVHDVMIWEKPTFSMPSSNRYHQCYEYMFILTKGKPKTFNPICDRPRKWKKPLGKNTIRQTNGEMKDLGERIKDVDFGNRFNVWKMNTVAQENPCKKIEHPATYPKQLVYDHLLTWSNENDIILDPFMGSGTTAIIAEQLNRKWLGIEISKEYCDMAINRLEENRKNE